VAQEVADLSSKLLRVALVVEVDAAARPVDVGLLGPIRVVAGSNRQAKAIEKAHAATW
jgi:hypothetical protein